MPERKLKKNISQIYRIQIIREELDALPYIKKWEEELGSQCNKHTLEKKLKLTHCSAVDTKMSETNYKCLAWWYATPDKVSKVQPEKSVECWRGCKVPGTMAHIWWECSIIKEFWKEVLQIIKNVTNKEIPEDPWICLFHGTESSIRQYKTSIIPILVNAAKGQIPKKWQEVDCPKIRDWIFCVNEIYNLESLDDKGVEWEEGIEHKDKWEMWLEFKKNMEIC